MYIVGQGKSNGRTGVSRARPGMGRWLSVVGLRRNCSGQEPRVGGREQKL